MYNVYEVYVDKKIFVLNLVIISRFLLKKEIKIDSFKFKVGFLIIKLKFNIVVNKLLEFKGWKMYLKNFIKN